MAHKDFQSLRSRILFDDCNRNEITKPIGRKRRYVYYSVQYNRRFQSNNPIKKIQAD